LIVVFGTSRRGRHSSSLTSPNLVKTKAFIYQRYQRFRGPPFFKGRQPAQPTTAYSSRKWFTGSHNHPFDWTFVAYRGSIDEAESEWAYYLDTVLLAHSLGVGVRGAATLRCALKDLSTCCTDGSRFGSILASITRPSKHGSHHVCDNCAPPRTWL
jgi:hypothetical protein